MILHFKKTVNISFIYLGFFLVAYFFNCNLKIQYIKFHN